MRRCSILTVCLAAVLYAAPARAASITFDPVSADTSVFQMPIGVQNVQDLVAYAFTVSFDPAFLDLVSLTEGPALSSGGGTSLACTYPGTGAGEIPCLFDSAAASLEVGNFLLDPGTGPYGVTIGAVAAILNTLAFQPLQNGTTTVTIAFITMNDSLGLITDVPESVSANVTIGTTQVPEPATMMLMSVGLAYVARRRYRRS